MTINLGKKRQNSYHFHGGTPPPPPNFKGLKYVEIGTCRTVLHFMGRQVTGIEKNTWVVLGSAPRGTGSPGPFGPGSPKESEKSPERVPRKTTPESRKSAPRSLKRVGKESESQVLDSLRTLLRLRGALFRDSGSPSPGNSFRDSFRTLSGSRARRVRETLCQAGPILRPVAKLKKKDYVLISTGEVVAANYREISQELGPPRNFN